MQGGSLMKTRLSKILHTAKPIGLIGLALTLLVPTALAQPLEVIVDNRDPNTEQIKKWWPSVAPNPFGEDSVKQQYPGAFFSWYPRLPRPGDYNVYAWWTYHPNRSSSVSYTITHDDGSWKVQVNQQDPNLGGQWNLLGRFTFSKPGRVPKVTVDTTSGQASADAVRFVFAGELPPEPGEIIGFYSVFDGPEQLKIVAPGEYGEVKSTCAPGDYAVSGTIVTSEASEVYSPDFHFRTVFVGLSIDINTKDQSWILSGYNESPAPIDAEIHVRALCADVAD